MDEAAVIAAFLESYGSDREAGRTSPLEAYQSRFPGYERTIAGEFASLESLALHGLPERVGHYRILRELARGGQGDVYLAEDERLQRRVALKLLRRLSSEGLLRFRREAEVASRLDHPGICTVYEAGFSEGSAFIAMRFVEGRSLAEEIRARRAAGRVQDRALLLRDAELVEKAARALHAAHEAGIVHRDVKPGNLMVKPGGEPVWLDFGLASDAEAESLTRTGDFLGTPSYMSPEQVEGRPLDRRSDVYSLGATLYELLTLHPPFEAPTREGLDRAIRLEEPADPRRRAPGVPRDMAIVVGTALRKEPDRRYATAQALAEDLARVREGRPILAKPASALGRAARWARRRPAAAALVASLAVALPALASLGGYLYANLPAIRAEQDREFRARVERLLEAGYRELGDRSNEKAARTFQAVQELDPGSVEGACGVALAALRENPRIAIESLERVPETVERVPTLRRILVEAHRRLGEEERADGIQRSIPDPQTALDFFILAMRDLDRGHRGNVAKFRSAQFFLEQAVLLTTAARPLYHMELAHAISHTGDRAAAERIAEALTALWPESAEALVEAAAVEKDISPERAAAACRRAIELDPANSEAHNVLGMALERLGKSDDSLAERRRALAIDPDNLAARENLAGMLLGKGLVEEGIAELREVLRRNPRYANGWLRLAQALCGRREVAAALDAARKAVELQPDRAEAHQVLGSMLHANGRQEESIAAYRRSLELDESDPLAHFNLAERLKAGGELDEAERHYRRTLELLPGDAESHQALGDILLQRGRCDPAVEEFRLAIAGDKGYALAWLGLGDALRGKGDLPAAVDAWCEAARVKQDSRGFRPGAMPDGSFHRNVGARLLGAGRHEEARVELEKARALQPDDAGPLALLGAAAFELGRNDEAVRLLREAVARLPDNPAAHHNLALALAKCGDFEESMEQSREAMRLAPGEPDFPYTLGISLRDCGRYEEAIPCFRKALELRRDFTDARDNLGLACSRLRRYAESVTTFRDWVAAAPADPLPHARLAMELQLAGELGDSLQEWRKVHELAPNRPGWNRPTVEWIAAAERRVEVAAGMDAGREPGPDEALAFAEVAQYRGRHADATRFYRLAFATNEGLARDAAHLARAGSSAAMAGERDRAVEWLRLALDVAAEDLEAGKVAAGDLREWLERWKADPWLASIREGEDWRLLREAVDRLLERTRPRG